MKIFQRLIWLAVLGGVGWWLWTLCFPSPEKQVLKQVARLAASANIAVGDGPITRASKAVSVSSEFATDAEIALDAPGVGPHNLSGREEIHAAALGGFSSLSALHVQFRDATAKVGADRQSAEVDCTAEVSAGDNHEFGVQELRFQFKKIDGDWLITRAETVKPLQ
jgi:hypothetical protein